MKKVSPINRALRPVDSTARREAPGSRLATDQGAAAGHQTVADRRPRQDARRVSGEQRVGSEHRGNDDLRIARRRRAANNRRAPERNFDEPQPDPRLGREQLRGLFEQYQNREQEQQFTYLEQKFSDSMAELNARLSSQEQQIKSLQSTLDSERRLSQTAVANLKDLFDGNYQVMSDISERYEDSQQAFFDEKAGFDRRLEFIQQESLESTNQLRSAIIKSQDEDRVNLAESLRALADSIDRKN